MRANPPAKKTIAVDVDQPCAWCGKPVVGGYVHFHDDNVLGVRIVHHAALGDEPGCTSADPLFDDLVDHGTHPKRKQRLVAAIAARAKPGEPERVRRIPAPPKKTTRRLKVKR